MRRFGFLATLLLASAPLGAQGGEILNIGDAAPPLKVSKWVKGQPVTAMEPGQTYVVEFWATWCGPCRASIPHLTELAHKYRDKGVRFVGVDVWERDLTQVEPFLKEMGAKMDYNVALDDVPEGKSADDGAMASTWMKAAEENGIPAAFIIRDGKIQWIGHPMEMDKPLEEVVAGTYAVGNKPAERLAEKLKERKLDAAQAKVLGPFRQKDYKATLAAISEITTSDPELVGEFAPIRYAALCRSGDLDAGLKLGDELFAQSKDKPSDLSNLAMMALGDDLKQPTDPRVARQALRFAQRAVAAQPDAEYYTLNALADAQDRTGDPAAAVATQEKAIASLKGRIPDDHPFLKQLAAKVERFRKAAEAKAGKP